MTASTWAQDAERPYPKMLPIVGFSLVKRMGTRKYPGDVCVRSREDATKWEKAFEVRDKPVTETDVRIFAKKCVNMGVREAGVLMASEKPNQLNGHTSPYPVLMWLITPSPEDAGGQRDLKSQECDQLPDVLLAVSHGRPSHSPKTSSP